MQIVTFDYEAARSGLPSLFSHEELALCEGFRLGSVHLSKTDYRQMLAVKEGDGGGEGRAQEGTVALFLRAHAINVESLGKCFQEQNQTRG